MEKGYIHVYTGNGKGKTTAAFGLAIRSLGHNLKVYIGEFVKSMEYGEVKFLKDKFENVTIELLGTEEGCFIDREVNENDYINARKQYQHIVDVVSSDKYDVVILDEIFIGLYFKLLSEEDILNIMEVKNPHVELILTGRYAPQSILDKADLVSVMEEYKHYYQQGVLARDGIER